MPLSQHENGDYILEALGGEEREHWSNLERQQLREQVSERVGRMPEKTRRIIALYNEGLKFEEMSAALGMPLGSVKATLYRAVKTLRDEFNPEK